MFSRIAKHGRGTAAWRISLWSSVAFAVGTALAFWFLQHFLANEIQDRADSWLTGELGVLADVAERTPEDQLHDTIVQEVAELASHEIPSDETSRGEVLDRAVFFLQTGANGQVKLHTGAAAAVFAAQAPAIVPVAPQQPINIELPGFNVPFRMTGARLSNGDRIYLALSSEHEREVLSRLRTQFMVLWFAIIALGSLIVFVSTRRMLRRIQQITETAETIGRRNLKSRVPGTMANDEISRLSITLNHMLDRIENSVQQLHAMSDALAHDIRSPLTSLRGKIEFALLSEEHSQREISLAQCIEQVDQLSSLLNTSLDVSEASVDALRLRKERLDIGATLQSFVELYEPAFVQAGLSLQVSISESLSILADPALVQRIFSNLLDNELKHLAPGCSVTISIQCHPEYICATFEDDGEGFPPDLLPHVFDRYAKGDKSSGFGLGLAFVWAVVRSHDGHATAENRPEGGARIRLELPLAQEAELALAHK